MARSNFFQGIFTGGIWSASAQGRMTDPAYKTALNVDVNGYALEAGAWIRRPGSRFLGFTRSGNKAVLRAFDFTITQPYQIEFTNTFARMWAGLAQVTTDDTVYVTAISQDTPAVVTVAGTLPAGWSSGDHVNFEMLSSPCAGPLLCGRQFKISGVTDNTFTLFDEITAAGIDGSTIAYTPGSTLDKVHKILELTTVYAEAELSGIRTVQDDKTVLLLTASHKPYVISEGTSPSPFAIAAQDLSDGPYLDVNDTTTTLTPSGTSGSITVSASATTGINDDTGFQSTDVGRLIRFQGGPAEWDSGTTYAKNAIVLGSDNNVYKSLTGANTNNDPTTDDGTHWQIEDQTVTWTWLKITAVGSTTSVTATIMGDDLDDTTATTVWQLGVYSDTTGWPTAGGYHEGRLWLTSKAFPNRIDSSKSNDHYNFAPTDTDGTVADDNGISAIFNANDVNAIFWFQSTVDGLKLGTQAGEWLIKASALDDPISPSNIQARRVTTFGCADIEPVEAWSKTIFVEREKRRLIEHGLHPWLGKYQGNNIAEKADSLTSEGLAELRWQQAPNLNLWLRTESGSLKGVNYKNTLLDDTKSFAGWHEHTLGSGRIVESISTGPSFDGLSDSLYFVSRQTTADAVDENVRWVECLMPPFEPGTDECDGFHVDGGAIPCCATLLGTSPNYTGLRLYGLNHLEGYTIQPFIGGLDLGDYTVSGGKIDIAFADSSKGHDAALFTLAYFQSLTTCDITGASADVQTGTEITPPVDANTLMAVVGDESTVSYPSSGGVQHLNHTAGRIIQVCASSGLILMQSNPPGDDVLEATELVTFGDAGGGTPNHTLSASHGGCFHPGNSKFFIGVDSTTNSMSIAKIDATTLVADEVVGTASSSTSPSTADGTTGVLTRLLASSQMIPVSRGSTHYLVSRATSGQEVAVLNVTTTGNMLLLQAVAIDEDVADICPGVNRSTVSTFYAIGRDSAYGAGLTTPFGVYAYSVAADGLGGSFDTECHVNPNAAVSRQKVGTVAPADIDAEWTEYTLVEGCGYDQADGNLLVWVQSPSGVTNRFYLAKINSVTAEVMWTSIVGSGTHSIIELAKCNLNGTLCYFTGTPDYNVVTIDLSDGSTTTTAWNHGFNSATEQVFDYLTGSITMNCGYTESATGPVPAYVGDYLAANDDEIPSQRWGRLYTGTPYTSDAVVEYPFYGTIGFTYTSQGQLLRPDFGNDAGARQGPSFGLLRRIHKYAISLFKSRGVSIGTKFDSLNAVPLASAGGTAVASPNLFTGIVKETLNDDYSRDRAVCWQITRPYPCMITAVGGNIEAQDE